MILSVYFGAEPTFPAVDQHPTAVRYRVGAVLVDAIGGTPSQAEIDAVLAPPPPQPTLDDVIAALPQTSKDALAGVMAVKLQEANIKAVK
jgi:hypothetical protein